MSSLVKILSDIEDDYLSAGNMTKAAAVQAAVQQIESMQWIPVSERLPEIEQGADCVSVLVQFQPSYLGPPRISTAEYRRDGTWAFMDAAPLRWMPLTVLPQP